MNPSIDAAKAGDRAARIAVVTGASGFIGQHLCRRLLAEGWQVRAVDLERRAGLPEADSLRFVQVDIRDADALQVELRGVDTVFHLASAHLQINAPQGWYESVNVDAVRSLVAGCFASSVRRLVHVSSVGIYGHVERPPADEDAPKRPTNEYERTKLLGETAALQSAREHGLDLIVLRPGWVYGPGCPRTGKLLRAIRRGRFVYIGAGTNQRHPIYVDDFVEAMLAAERAPAASSGRAYLIVGSQPVTVRELVQTAAQALNVAAPARRLPRTLMIGLARAVELSFGILRRQPPISRRSLAFFEHDNAFDGRLARQALAFEPRVSLSEGLSRTVASLWPPEPGVQV